jgi:HEAT repeat protein
MGKRLSLDDKLDTIRRLRDDALSSEQTAFLRHAIRDRSNLVVAAAAAVVGDKTVAELAADLEAAFARFLVGPTKDDKLCRAKVAVIQALDRLDHERAEVFLTAARHIQFEPVWGGVQDSAGPLRAAAIYALARIGCSECMPVFVDALIDPEREVRLASAQALASRGTESAGLLLRLKTRTGDADPEVLAECLAGLLSIDAAVYLPLVSQMLDPTDETRCEAAALALARSRTPESLDLLTSCWQRAGSAGLKDRLLLALALLRLPAAIDYLLQLVASDSERFAVSALAALKIHRHDARLRQRIARVLNDAGNARLQARFERDFPPLGDELPASGESIP